MIKRSLLLLLLALITSLLRPTAGQAGRASVAPSVPAAQAPGLHLRDSSPLGVTVELTAPDSGALLAPAPGLGRTGEPGRPQLPLLSTLIGVPASASLRLEVLADDAEDLAGSYDIPPAPSATPATPDPALAGQVDDPLLAIRPGRLSYERDAATYTSLALYPAQAARLADEAWLRDQRLVRLELYPLQYSPAARSLRWHRRLLVRVHFDGAEQGDRSGSARGASQAPRERGAQSSPFEAQLRAGLLNYDQARTWRELPAAGAVRGIVDSTSSTTQSLKIVVDHDAIYRLTYAELQSALQAAGLSLTSVNPLSLRMTRRGEDVAIAVEGDGDTSFEADDSVLFFGRKFDGTSMEERYTDEDVYWLSWGGAPGPQMALVDAAPTDQWSVPTSYSETLHAEHSARYWHGDLSTKFTNQDMWYWDFVQPPSSTQPYTKTYSASLTAPALDVLSATLRADILGYTGGKHHTRLYLNGGALPVADVIWPVDDQGVQQGSGTVHKLFSVTIPHSMLVSGTVDLKMEIAGDLKTDDVPPKPIADQVLFNWFAIDYARQFVATNDQLRFKWTGAGARQFESTGFTTPTVAIYDISDPLQPRRLLQPRIAPAGDGYQVAFEPATAAGEYLLAAPTTYQSPKRISLHTASDLREAGVGADYIVITHQKFITASQELADYRASQGLRTRVIDVATLYDEFNHGIYNPIAIKHFLSYAMTSWAAPAPAYVVLVGDGHYDMKGFHTNNTAVNYMPPHLAWVDPFIGEVDSSNQLASVVGDDILPDLAIGRMPVNEVVDLLAIIKKTKTFEIAGEQPWQELWRRRLLFFADDYIDAGGNIDMAGNFPASAEEIASAITAPYSVTKIYHDPWLADGLMPHGVESNTFARQDLIAALNQGYLFVNYTGHGSIMHWGNSFLTSADVPLLTNAGTPSIFLSMTCLDGKWYETRNNHSLTEVLLRAQGGGAAATFSATGQGLNLAHEPLNRAFYHAVYQAGARTMGEAAFAGRLATYATGTDFDQVEAYTVIGDPALRLPTAAKARFLPQVALTGQ